MLEAKMLLAKTKDLDEKPKEENKKEKKER